MIPVVVGSNPIGHPIPSAASRAQKWRALGREHYAGAAAAFAAIARAALEQVRLNAAGFARSTDPEFLHQLRVGLRRLRAALRAFHAVLPRRESRAIVRRLRKLSPPLGAARDWDVFCEWLARHKALGAAPHARRVAARQRARKAVRSAEFAQALARVETLSAGPSGARPLRELARKVLEKAYRRVLKSAKRMDWSDAARRHKLRIRVKRLRYSCEYFLPAYGPAGAPYVERLRGLQELLGELNDVAVARRLLASLPRTAPRLRQGLARRDSRALTRLPAAWRAFAKAQPFWAPPG